MEILHFLAQNPRLINKSRFKSRAAYDDALTVSSIMAQAINSGIYWCSWALLNYSKTFFNLSKDNRSITAIKIKDIISFEDNRTSGRPNQKMVKPIHKEVKSFLKYHYIVFETMMLRDDF